jgi:hypothetical protein
VINIEDSWYIIINNLKVLFSMSDQSSDPNNN